MTEAEVGIVSVRGVALRFTGGTGTMDGSGKAVPLGRIGCNESWICG